MGVLKCVCVWVSLVGIVNTYVKYVQLKFFERLQSLNCVMPNQSQTKTQIPFSFIGFTDSPQAEEIEIEYQNQTNFAQVDNETGSQ